LRQYRLLTSAERKPLALLALLEQLKGQPTLVFASSLETTHRWGAWGTSTECMRPAGISEDLKRFSVACRLALLLQAALRGQEVVEYSSSLPAQQRASALQRFTSGDSQRPPCN
jgi:superfamily II DNA/RNA helicase